MRILYFHQYFVTPDMAGGTRSYEIARRLADRGHDVHVISSDRNPDDRSPLWRSEAIANFQVHWCATPYSNRFGFARRVAAFLKFAWFSGSKGISLGSDFVIATSTPLTIAIPGVRAARKLQVPLLFEVRDLWPELPIAIGALRNPLLKWAAERLERYAYNNSDHVVALSTGMKSGVVKAGFPKERVTVATNCCDPSRFQSVTNETTSLLDEHPELKGKRLVLYAGTLGKINGVSFLVDVAKHAAQMDSSVGFLVIGDGLERESIEAHARQAKVLNQNFWMIPSVPKHKVASFFKAATVSTSLFIDLPEMWHNSANKFFDGLAAGKPVMINYQGWQANVLESSGAGIVVPPGDARQAAKQLCSLMADEARLRSCSAAALRLSKEEFGVEQVFDKFNDAVAAACLTFRNR